MSSAPANKASTRMDVNGIHVTEVAIVFLHDVEHKPDIAIVQYVCAFVLGHLRL